jgi:hypothetical protein
MPFGYQAAATLISAAIKVPLRVALEADKHLQNGLGNTSKTRMLLVRLAG